MEIKPYVVPLQGGCGAGGGSLAHEAKDGWKPLTNVVDWPNSSSCPKWDVPTSAKPDQYHYHGAGMAEPPQATLDDIIALLHLKTVESKVSWKMGGPHLIFTNQGDSLIDITERADGYYYLAIRNSDGVVLSSKTSADDERLSDTFTRVERAVLGVDKVIQDFKAHLSAL